MQFCGQTTPGELSANAGKTFAGNQTIALGLVAGTVIVWLFRRDEAEGV